MWRRTLLSFRYQRHHLSSFSRQKYWGRNSRKFEFKYYPILAFTIPLYLKNEQGEYIDMDPYIYGATLAFVSIGAFWAGYKNSLPHRAQINIKSCGQRYVTLNIKNDGNITAHKVEYSEIIDDKNKGYEWRIIEKLTNNSNVDCRINELKPNTNYIIRVTSMNKIGYGEQSEVIRIKTKQAVGAPDPPRVELNSLGKNHVALKIKNDDIIGHRLQYVEVDNIDKYKTAVWKNIQIDSKANDHECTIQSLKPNTNYLITVASRNEMGYGSNSDIWIVKTTNNTWCGDIVGDNIHIGNNGNQARFSSYNNNWHTVYSNDIIQPNEIYEWTLRINNHGITSHESSSQECQHVWYIFVGICKDNEQVMRQSRNTWPNDVFVYGGKRGCLAAPRNENYPQTKFINPGDTLKVKVDLKKMQVQLNINGVDCGIVPGVQLEKANYRLWVSIYEKPLEMQLINSKQIVSM